MLQCSTMPVRFLFKIKQNETYATLVYVIVRTMVSVFCIALITWRVPEAAKPLL